MRFRIQAHAALIGAAFDRIPDIRPCFRPECVAALDCTVVCRHDGLQSSDDAKPAHVLAGDVFHEVIVVPRVCSARLRAIGVGHVRT